MSFEKMEIDKIRVDMGTQTRASMDPESVKVYADALKADPNCRPDSDPVVVFKGEDGSHVLASGFHWLAAARLAGVKELRVKVEKGTPRDALLYAAGTNEAHGLRLTNADKRHKIKMVLSDHVWKKRSNAWVAQQCRVSEYLVQEVQKAMQSSSGSTSQTRGSQTRTGRDGKERPAKKAAKKTAKNGQQAAYDWKGFSAAWGALVREVDKFGNVHKAKDTPEANGLRRKLEEWKKDFRAWFKAVTKKAAPEE